MACCVMSRALARDLPSPPSLVAVAGCVAAKELLFDWVPPNMFVGPYPQCDEDVQTMKVKCSDGAEIGGRQGAC